MERNEKNAEERFETARSIDFEFGARREEQRVGDEKVNKHLVLEEKNL